MSPPENNIKEDISTVILCAGEGTRISEQYNDIPKPLILVPSLGDIPILQNTLDNLKKLGIQKIFVIKGHLGHKIDEFILSYDKNIEVIDSGFEYLNGPAYSLSSMHDSYMKIFRPHLILLLPGDTIFEFEIIQYIFKIMIQIIKAKKYLPIIFYRNIYVKELKDHLWVSIIELQEICNQMVLKEIRQLKLRNLDENKVIKQIIPVFVLTKDYLSRFYTKDVLESYRKTRERNIESVNFLESELRISEVINSTIKDGSIMNAIEISKEYNYYDIDYKTDLDEFKRREKKRQ